MELTRREAIAYAVIGTAGLLGFSAFAHTTDAYAFELSDGMGVYIQPDDAKPGELGEFVISGLSDDMHSLCPHVGVWAGPAGTYAVYDIDKHHELIENPPSGTPSASRSAERIIADIKIILYWGWFGPGFDASWWVDFFAAHSDGVNGRQRATEYNVGTYMHVLISRRWFGTGGGRWGCANEPLDECYEALKALDDAKGNPSKNMQVFMAGMTENHQEPLFFKMRPTGFASGSKVPRF